MSILLTIWSDIWPKLLLLAAVIGAAKLVAWLSGLTKLSKHEVYLCNNKQTFSKQQLEQVADYFHRSCPPDYDGYVGHYALPKDVMKIYIAKYSKDREWDDEE